MSEEVKINEVRKIKDNVLRHTSLLSGHFSNLSPVDCDEDEETIRHIKMEFNTIIKEISLLRGYCSKKGKKHIGVLSDIGGQLSLPSRRKNMRVRRMSTDYWIGLINSLEISDAKYPFEITGDMKINWKLFEGHIKASYTTMGFPDWACPATIVVLGLLVLYLRTR